MITTTINVNSLNRGLKKDRGFIPPKRTPYGGSKLSSLRDVESTYSKGIKPVLRKGKPLNLSIKPLHKGKNLIVDGNYSDTKKVSKYVLEEDTFTDELLITNIGGTTVKEPNLVRGKRLDIKGVSLQKGNNLKVGGLDLSEGVSLKLVVDLQRGKDLTKNSVIEKYKELVLAKKSVSKKVVGLKQKDLVNDLSCTNKDKCGDISAKDITEKTIPYKSIRDTINTKDTSNKIETVDIIEEQKREDNRLVKDVEDVEVKKIDDDVVYKQGMSLYDFLKENPKKRTEDVILTYFNASDLKALIDSGKVLKKRGKLII